jgi:hypothetical protein
MFILKIQAKIVEYVVTYLTYKGTKPKYTLL